CGELDLGSPVGEKLALQIDPLLVSSDIFQGTFRFHQAAGDDAHRVVAIHEHGFAIEIADRGAKTEVRTEAHELGRPFEQSHLGALLEVPVNDVKADRYCPAAKRNRTLVRNSRALVVDRECETLVFEKAMDGSLRRFRHADLLSP